MYNELFKFREERGLQNSPGNLSANIIEETQELLVAIGNNDEYEIIDALCDHVVFVINGLEAMGHDAKTNVTITEWRDFTPTMAASLILVRMGAYVRDKSELYSLSSIAGICLATIEKLGYHSELCMLETCKEINSREGAYNPDVGKWQKFKTPEAMSKWYKADYSACKKEV